MASNSALLPIFQAGGLSAACLRHLAQFGELPPSQEKRRKRWWQRRQVGGYPRMARLLAQRRQSRFWQPLPGSVASKPFLVQTAAVDATKRHGRSAVESRVVNRTPST